MIITGAALVRTLVDWRFAVVGPVSGSINAAGTAPRVLFPVICRWVRAVVIKFLLAVGSRACMIAGASDICGVGNMAVILSAKAPKQNTFAIDLLSGIKFMLLCAPYASLS